MMTTLLSTDLTFPMRARYFRYLWVWLIACMSSPLALASTPIIPVNAAAFQQLDSNLNNYQLAYIRDHRKADELNYAFLAFTSALPSSDTSLSLWVKAMPDSYAAHLARGIFLYAQGNRARGSDTYANTPATQIQQMNGYFNLARKELIISLRLSPQPLLSYVYLIRLQSHYGTSLSEKSWLNRAAAYIFDSNQGNEPLVVKLITFLFHKEDKPALDIPQSESSLHWLAESIKIDSGNFWARHAYLLSLRPQWGGSLTEMQNFVSISNTYPLTPATRNGLQAQLIRAQARQYRFNQHYEAAITAYTDALNLYEEADAYQLRGFCYHSLNQSALALADYTRAITLDPRNSDAYEARAGLYFDLKDLDAAYRDYTRLTELNPGNAVGWNYRGWIKRQQQQPAEAASYYERSVALNDAWAQNELGFLYAHGIGVPKNIVIARSLWQAASNQGNEDATKHLKENIN